MGTLEQDPVSAARPRPRGRGLEGGQGASALEMCGSVKGRPGDGGARAARGKAGLAGGNASSAVREAVWVLWASGSSSLPAAGAVSSALRVSGTELPQPYRRKGTFPVSQYYGRGTKIQFSGQRKIRNDMLHEIKHRKSFHGSISRGSNFSP